MDWATWVRSPTQPESFSSNLCIQTSPGAHLISCTMGGWEGGGSFTGCKASPGHGADHSSPSSAEVKIRWYTPPPPPPPSTYMVCSRTALPFPVITTRKHAVLFICLQETWKYASVITIFMIIEMTLQAIVRAIL
jgi:hypothetical protein